MRGKIGAGKNGLTALSPRAGSRYRPQVGQLELLALQAGGRESVQRNQNDVSVRGGLRLGFARNRENKSERDEDLESRAWRLLCWLVGTACEVCVSSS